MEYKNFTKKQLEDIIEQLTPDKREQRHFNLYMSKGAQEMFNKAVSEIIYSWSDNLNISFRTESGKEIKIPYSEYDKLKQETKDKLEPYRINGNI